MGDQKSTPSSSGVRRRIVKASTPRTSAAVEGGGNAGVKDSGGEYSLASQDPLDLSENEQEKKSVLRGSEDQDSGNAEDIVERNREERRASLEESRRIKREKQLAQHRRGSPQAHRNNAKPNPFSKFLSYFSVEPEHPTHKRSFETGDTPLEEPIEKRMRLDTDEGGRPAGRNNINLTYISAGAVAVVAVTAFFLYRGVRKS